MSSFSKGLFTAAVGIAAWSTLVEPNLFTVRRHLLPLLPDGAAPLRILQLSDLHMAPWHRHKVDWVSRLAELRPDLLVLTGDQMGHSAALNAVSTALQPFADVGVPGVFVHGSNDYYSPIIKNPLKYLREPSGPRDREPDLDTDALTQRYLDLGFTDLNNSATRMHLRGVDVELFGLGDPHINLDDAGRMRDALTALDRPIRKGTAKARSLPSQTEPVRIGVVHAPYQRALNALLNERADLIIAGHTHGGQVRVPLVGALTSNCDLPPRQSRGMSVWFDAHNAAFLNVSAGLGASIYSPMRFACRPEASMITLESVRD